MTDYVARATYTLDDQVSANAAKIGAALGAMGAAADVAEAAVTKTGRTLQGSVNRYDEVANKTRALTAAMKEQSRVQDQVTDALARGEGDAGTYSRTLDGLAAKVDKARAALVAAKASTTDSAASFNILAAAADRAAASQDKYNRLTGIAPITSADAYSKRAADIAAYGDSLDALRSKFDPVFAASKRYESVLDEIAAAEKTGALNANVANAARDRATQSYQDLLVPAAKIAPVLKDQADAHEQAGASAKSQSFALRQLGVQSVQAISGIASGQPILTTFIQQGHQVVDVAFSTGTGFGVMGAAVKAVGGFFLTTAGAITAAAAVLGVLAYSAESTDRSLAQLQNRLQSTRDDYKALAVEVTAVAKQIAGAGLASKDDATSAAASIAGSRNFTGSSADLKALVVAAADAAAALGETLPAAAGRFVAAMKSPKDAIQSFIDQGLKGANEQLLDQVTRLQDSGHAAEAAAIAINTLKNATAGAADNLTPLQKALRDLSASFYGTAQGGETFAHAIGEALTTAAAAGIGAIASIMGALNGAFNTAKGLAPPAGGGDPFTANDQRYVAGGANFAAGIQRLPSDIRAKIYGEGAAQGLRPELQGFAAATAGFESNGQNLAANGVGATGIGQIKPGTAAQYGVGNLDLTNPAQNIQAMITIIKKLDEQFGGDFSKISAAYTGGSGTVDPTSRGYRPVLSKESSDRLTNLGLSAPAGQSLYAGSAAQAADNAQQAALKTAREVGGITPAQNKIADQYTQLSDARTALGPGKEGTAEWQALTAAMIENRKAAYSTVDGVTAANRASADAIEPLNHEAGAARDVAEARNKIRIAAQQDGRTVTEGELADATFRAYQKLNAALSDNLLANSRAVAGQAAVNDQVLKGARSTVEATDAERAKTDALKYGAEGSSEYRSAVNDLTESYRQQAAVKADSATASQLLAQRNDLETIETETRLVAASTEQREKELAVLKERQRIIGTGGDVNDAASKESLANVAKIADAKTNVTQLQNSLTAIGDIGSNAFQTIGNSITQAFANGTIKALNFGDIMRATLAAAVQGFAQLAIINPVLNATLGGTRGTLGGALTALGGTGTGTTAAASGGLGLTDIAGYASTLSSASGALGGPTIGSALGLTGANSAGSALSGLTNYLGLTTAPGGFVGGIPGAYASGAAAQGSGLFSGLSNSVTSTLNTSVLGGTVGGYATGIGLGYGAGTLANSLLRGNQTNGQIGSAAGATAGALVGTLVLPGVGTVLGGLLGGVLGGTGGGLLGSKVHKAYGIDIGVNDSGTLDIASARNNHEPAYAAVLEQQQNEVDAINRLLDANGLKVGADTRITVGKGNSGPDGKNLDQAQDLQDEFGRIRFHSDDNSQLNSAIGGKSFGSADELNTFLTGFKAFTDSLPALLDPLKKNEDSLGSLQTALNAINTTYSAAETQAASYGRATDDLVAAQAQATQQVKDNADKALQGTLNGFVQRGLAANGDTQAAALLGFDTDADSQREAFKAQLIGVYGTAYEGSQDYVQKMLILEQTLGAERLKIAQQNGEDTVALAKQAQQQVAGVINSLASYASGLAVGSSSSLSSQDKYAYASSQFGSTSNKALGGDFVALQKLQAAADAFLTTSRDLNGSGAAYAADYEKVTGVLAAVGDASTDQLTASAMQQIQTDNTGLLQQAISGLQDALKGATADGSYSVVGAVYSGNAYVAEVVSASTEAYLSAFSALTEAVSHTTAVGLSAADVSGIMDYQTSRVVAAVQAVESQVYSLRQEFAQKNFGSTVTTNNYEGGYQGSEAGSRG